MRDAVTERSTEFTSSLIALSPIIEEIGFKTTGITLSIGLPPSAVFHFQKFQDIAPERREQIMEENKDNTMIKMGALKFSNIDVSIGLTPGVDVQLVPKV